MAASTCLLRTGSSREFHWFEQYNGYDPAFTWWVDQPYKDARKALSEYIAFLKEKVIGIPPDDKTTIIGDPVGRDALMAELVDSRKMTDREFHDAILHENEMPVELLRADLEGRPLTRGFKTSWKFYGEHPTHP